MSLILNIESATTVCSVSLSDKTEVIAFKEIDNGYTHAENLHVFINTLLAESGIEADQLSAIAISKGPGSYTGLRIGVSAAKGIAYALSIPLISVDTLQTMAIAAKAQNKTANYYCPMIDARRMEVYTALYNNEMQIQEETKALILDTESIEIFKQRNNIAFFGNGMPKAKELLSQLADSVFIENINPGARFMPEIAYKKLVTKTFEDVAYFEPFYLKDFLILSKKNQ